MKKAKILNTTGIVIMAIVILLMLPLTVPKLFGLKLYNVLSGSMEPTYKIGGVVYVKETEADEVGVGDVISYLTSSGTDIVTTHRVVAFDEDGYFITKGDANDAVDAEPVAPSRLVGEAVFYLPALGSLSAFIFSVKGACACVVLFAAVAFMWIYAGMLSPKSETSEPPKEKKATNRSTVVTILGIALIAIALSLGGAYGYGYLKADRDYDSIKEEFETALASDGAGASAPGTDPTAYLGGNGTADLFGNHSATEIGASLELLSSIYPGLVGWVLIPDTIIDYPIMQGSDDTFYLRHTYDNSWSRPGSIFLSCKNASDFSDRYNVVYGHNQNNGAMFSSLLNYDEDPDYLSEHPYFYIATADGVREYEIFSFFYVYPTDAMYTIEYYNATDYDILVKSCQAASRVDTGVTASEDDEILVLSTCNSTAKLRFVVCGKLK